ncbi:MAG: M3 family oligoendopeptidase [Micavibrio sp.]|nr:M3 family oligoendopeptidase [Micavibrio sp.]
MGNDDANRKPPAPPLPTWDLGDLFPSPESREFKEALNSVAVAVRDFQSRYKGRVKKLTGAQLGDAVAAFEKISEAEARIHVYAQLHQSVDATKAGWAQDVSAQLKQAREPLTFFTLEINKLAEDDLLGKIAAPNLAAYGPWIGQVRSMKDHQLAEPAEKYQAQMSVVTEEAWRRLYDQMRTDLRVSFKGEKLTEAEIANIIDTAADAADRKEAYSAYTAALGDSRKAFALITNTLIDLKSIDDRWRGFGAPEDQRHLENRIDKDTVAALAGAVQGSYAKTSHRYYSWKAKKFGSARLHPADRNAPLPGQEGRQYTWDEAREIVLSSFARISPDMAAIGQQFFDKGWIDAAPRAGKDSGGFSEPATPSTHPYILVNFFGSAGDVMTLAHELGHGIHQVLASKQGFFLSDTPLTLAETASVFGEMLAFKELLSRETDMIIQRNMIAGKIEDMLNTVVRQTAFFTFEQRLHAERIEKGELPPERISALWQETQKQSLGPAVNLDVPGAENLWMSIPHFIHTPFYVYAYAFGDCLVNALYDEYSKAADKKEFADKYIDLLKAGGTRKHDAALADFGFDTTDPLFWKKGLSVIERYIDDLIALDQKIEKTLKKQQDFKDNGKDVAAPANDDAPAAKKANKRAPKGPGAA